MKCASCNDIMVVLDLDDVEIDYCTQCGSIWLDEGELELLLESGEEKDALLASGSISETIKEDKKKCPICSKKMVKMVYEKGTESVVVDQCPKKHGVWFDKGELHQIIRMGSIDKKNKIAELLKEMTLNVNEEYSKQGEA